MVYIGLKNAPISASTKKKGVGKASKACTGTSIITRGTNITIKKPTDLEQPSDKNVSENGPPLAVTRSGRIKKNKDGLKLMEMDNILKNELLIEDRTKEVKTRIIVQGVNNNLIGITDQNKKANVRKNLNDNISSTSNNRYKPNKIGAKVNTKNKSKNKPLETMEPCLREEVINKMKSVLSPDNEFTPDIDLNNSRRFVRSRSRTSIVPKKAAKVKKNLENGAKKRTLETPVETADIRAAKMKQVTLSNGVVLTLALVKCDLCQKSFSSKQSLSRHMLVHVDLRPYMCSHCPRKFRYHSTLKIHLQRRHPAIQEVQKVPEYHMCHICDKAFLMEENLELHLASHVKTENNFKCLYCDKKFSYRLLLVQHEKTHLTTNKFKCYMCEMSYDCRSKLAHHIKTHKKVKDYICQYCGKEFLRLSGIKRHVRICHGGQRIQCPICMKKLKGHLTEHMRVHEQKRPHVCDECGQRFVQSTQLTVHKRSHTGDRPYPCKICKRPFGHSNALMLHIRRHTGEKPFACAMCPMTFSQLPHMKTHMNKIHGKEHAYKCKKCGEFFKLKVKLDEHAKICMIGDKELSFEEKIQASVQIEEVEVESSMSLSKMRFLLALLLTKIASKDKLKYLGFNKRLIDELLEESLNAMGHSPCKEATMSPYKRLKTNIEVLLVGTVPKSQMEKFRYENKTTEEILVLLTGE